MKCLPPRKTPFQHTVHRASLLPLTPIYFDFALFIVVLPVLCVGADSRFGDSFRGRSCLLPGLQCYSVSGQCGERTSFNQVLCCWSNKSDTGGPSINNVINSLSHPPSPSPLALKANYFKKQRFWPWCSSERSYNPLCCVKTLVQNLL